MSCNSMVTLPFADNLSNRFFVSVLVSGCKLMEILFPVFSLKPIDSQASVPISVWLLRIRSSTCITRFLSSSAIGGLSGPAVLQISSFWQQGGALTVNLLPEIDVAEELLKDKGAIRKNLGNHISQWLPARLAEGLLTANGFDPAARPADMQDKQLRRLGDTLNRWTIVPDGSEGYRKAEVTRGGVDTRALSQQSMMVDKVPGLYFIGEAVDVTGWLGGYNFQWAWASGVAAGKAI
ncbi:MAG: hypothetical protein EOO81_10250 [Oxalobacteraceae bacterium]|nr:MAG: hypothetical protein EOO81_10250 [Oxalobacteraceae bacterium]